MQLDQLQDRKLHLDVPVPNASVPMAQILNAGFLFAHDGPGVSEAPPELGQHTDEILTELSMSGDPKARATQ